MAREKMARTCTPVHLDTEATLAKRNAKNAHLVEPTWGQSDDGGPPLTELTSVSAGALSPFGEDHAFPLPVALIRYAHPTDKPNRAGVQVVEGR
jgi:hypothetical protein